MGVKEARRDHAVRRIWESVAASVVGGLILWTVTNSMSQQQAAPMTERMAVMLAPVAAPPATTVDADPANGRGAPQVLPQAVEFAGPQIAAPAVGPASTAGKAPASPVGASLSMPASIPGPTVAVPLARGNLLPYSVPVGTILLYENFSNRIEGDASGWGPNTFIRTGLDRRKWLVSTVEGTHPVGRSMRLPREFYFECRYSANMPEVTRGILGWWKEPVAGKISFLNDQGEKYSVDWVIKCGNDTTRINPLGSSSLCAKKFYHTIKLPDGTTGEVGVLQPTGKLRIERENNVVKVVIDGQAVAAGTLSQLGQLVGFEIDVVKAKNGTLFFTDFRIAR